jgi:putative addiction module killer protein
LAQYLVRHYQTPNGKKPFLEWLKGLDFKTTARILARMERFESGNFGPGRHLGRGLCEAILDFGPGYRLYYGIVGNEIVLLLVGGDKSTQSRDIHRAGAYWQDCNGGRP